MAVVRCGVIGLGHFGKHYVRLLPTISGAALAGVAGRVPESAEGLTAGLPASAKVFPDADALLADAGIDAVVIATPATTHAELARAALARGKHVLVEKPMVTSLPEAMSLRRAVRASSITFMVGHQYFYHDHVRALKAQLDRHALGTVRYLFAEHLYGGPLRSDVGVFWDAVTHELAIIEYLFGPRRISGARGASVSFPGSRHDDFTAVEMAFDGGLLAAVVASRFAPVKTRRMIIGGTAGLAVFDDLAEPQKVMVYPQPYPAQTPGENLSVFFPPVAGHVVAPAGAAREPLRNELEHFLDCIRQGVTPLTDIEHGVRITRQLHQIFQKISPAP